MIIVKDLKKKFDLDNRAHKISINALIQQIYVGTQNFLGNMNWT